PPEISAHLPGLSSLRRMNLCSSPSTRMSECAATKPSRLSVRTVSTELRNFFMAVLPNGPELTQLRTENRRTVFLESPWSAASLAGDAGYLLDEFVDRPVERGILLVVAEVGHDERHMARLARTRSRRQLAGMRLMIGGEELVALGRAEMADGKDRRQMP